MASALCKIHFGKTQHKIGGVHGIREGQGAVRDDGHSGDSETIFHFTFNGLV